VLRQLAPTNDPNALVATETADDAAVYRLDAETAIVSTVDYITPVVDDPFVYGQIAAANSLSDVWAMGGRPLFALNIVGFPPDVVPRDVLVEILRGGASKAAEAGVPILGGHTVRDDEPKYGLVVNGIVHPDRIIRNRGARPGDVLVLTKPLGIGIMTTAIKRDLASSSLIVRVTEAMTVLNRGAAEAMLEVGVSAATDVTGFGLLGHLREVTAASGVAAEISSSAVPVMDGADELASAGCVPGGSQDNLDFLMSGEVLQWDASIPEARKLVLADAQTSGGLLIAVPEQRSAQLLAALQRARTPVAAVIGRVLREDPAGLIRVLP
jgi:selenide, water dikinase